MNAMEWIALVVAAAVFALLLWALLRPERF
jgi:K+-transporting ATPase KdpF subunit